MLTATITGTTTETIDGGFAEPVFAAQSVFRAVMEAMARPGTVQPVAGLAHPPAPLSATAAAVALALCDHDTPLWLDPALAMSADVKAWLGFHSGAPIEASPTAAHFALVSDPAELLALENFAQGTQEYPDRSATLILQVASLAGGAQGTTPAPSPSSHGGASAQSATLMLKGPGIETEARLTVGPLPRHFVEQWKQNHARFPRGIDIVLAAPGAVACLPRTTRISHLET